MPDGTGETVRPRKPRRKPARDPGPGVRIAVDVGSVRVGVAVSDRDGILASPLVTLRRSGDGSDLARLAELVAERGAVQVLVGLPRHLSGAEGTAAEAARAYGADLASRVAPVRVDFVDERLSTVSATRTLSSRGVRGQRQRAVVDQAAAVVILQSWLDARASRQGGAVDE
ncbi:Holliday junction resolvase RuvX [Fodinicola acaciae]|uniref:Holliday junction resolvase RuvX n=1 Tax=Fodinicola acaciae TaxID=2681555 RepID=UPI0013CFA0F1|nr:Holliday junction resolvase RuvX [Fodinicola acaciae]